MDAAALNGDAIARGPPTFIAFQGQAHTLLQNAPPPPPLPQVMPDNRTSPTGEGQGGVTIVQNAAVFMDWCRDMINQVDQIFEISDPADQEKMKKLLGQLAGKVQQGARVQAIAEASVEVADMLEWL